MKHEYLKTMNSILEFIHRYQDRLTYSELLTHMIDDGISYPEKALTRLQEDVTDRLSQF